MKLTSGIGRGRLATALALLALACSSEADPVDAGRHRDVRVPPATLERVVFEGYRAGSREVEVRAESAEVDVVDRLAELRGVRISFEDEKRGSVVIRARSARFDLAADDFTLRDRVEGTTGRGESFVTADVRYEHERQMLFTDQPVVIHRDNMTLEGDGMELDLETHALRLKKVRSRVGPQ